MDLKKAWNQCIDLCLLGPLRTTIEPCCCVIGFAKGSNGMEVHDGAGSLTRYIGVITHHISTHLHCHEIANGLRGVWKIHRDEAY